MTMKPQSHCKKADVGRDSMRMSLFQIWNKQRSRAKSKTPMSITARLLPLLLPVLNYETLHYITCQRKPCKVDC